MRTGNSTDFYTTSPLNMHRRIVFLEKSEWEHLSSLPTSAPILSPSLLLEWKRCPSAHWRSVLLCVFWILPLLPFCYSPIYSFSYIFFHIYHPFYRFLTILHFKLLPNCHKTKHCLCSFSQPGSKHCLICSFPCQPKILKALSLISVSMSVSLIDLQNHSKCTPPHVPQKITLCLVLSPLLGFLHHFLIVHHHNTCSI